MKASYFITGIIVAALGVTAVAASPWHGGKDRGARGPMHSFEELDANADGFVTQDEMQAHAKARFDQTDANGDGVLSVDEMQAMALGRMQQRAGKMAGHMLERRDANGDGVLSLEEMTPAEGRQTKMMKRVDTDGDGKISKEEFEAMQGKMRHARKGMRHGMGEGTGAAQN